MKQTKIRLSPSESELVQDAGVILTKNRIIQKSIDLLAEVQEWMLSEPAPLHHRYGSVPPKISRGENYEGLPYVVLDYPRLSGEKGILFIRSMFWWGRHFSSTLQLSGIYREVLVENLSLAYEPLAVNQYFIGISADPWQHHFREENYKAVEQLQPSEFGELLQRQPHTKIAAQWPLQQWDDAAGLLLQSWKFLGELIT